MINDYINHTGEKERILLPTPASNLVRLLHLGTGGTCKKQVPCVPVLLVMRLELCNRGPPGKGTLFTYPPSKVPTVGPNSSTSVWQLKGCYRKRSSPGLSRLVEAFRDVHQCLHNAIGSRDTLEQQVNHILQQETIQNAAKIQGDQNWIPIYSGNTKGIQGNAVRAIYQCPY